ESYPLPLHAALPTYQRMLGAHHPPRKRRRGDDTRRKNQVAKGVPPRTLLAVDRAERQAADGQRDDGSADPVERWRLALLAALRRSEEHTSELQSRFE